MFMEDTAMFTMEIWELVTHTEKDNTTQHTEGFTSNRNIHVKSFQNKWTVTNCHNQMVFTQQSKLS